MLAQVFYRTWNRDRARSRVRHLDVEVDQDATLEEVLEESGAPSGVRTWSGAFEVQTDLGIWDRADGGPLWKGGARFRTWEDIEAEEVAS